MALLRSQQHLFPALTLNYLAQGSLILRSPATVKNPFFLLVPAWAQIPMVLLATVATVIASQSVISGAFSEQEVFRLPTPRDLTSLQPK